MPSKSPRIFPLLSALALAGLLLAACGPAQAPPATLPADLPAPTATLAQPGGSPPADAPMAPVVTPRGPELVASDPSQVSLASGQLQLVEFFRFT